jgi:hypothetical protein
VCVFSLKRRSQSTRFTRAQGALCKDRAGEGKSEKIVVHRCLPGAGLGPLGNWVPKGAGVSASRSCGPMSLT